MDDTGPIFDVENFNAYLESLADADLLRVVDRERRKAREHQQRWQYAIAAAHRRGMM